MQTAPKIVCFMPTYNRVTHPSVAESVEAFLRQDYPNAELIIYNDCGPQKIVFNHPKVRVVNVPDRAKSLSEACNIAVAMTDGEYVTMWTDDDIRLPQTLSLSMKALFVDKYCYEHATIGPHFYSVGNVITGVVASAVYQTGIFSRKLWDDLGGYDPVRNQDHDQDMEHRVGTTGRSRGGVILRPEDSFLIYRWGDGHYHLSGQLPTSVGCTAQYAAQARRPVTAGVFEIVPSWRRDYVADAREAVVKYSR